MTITATACAAGTPAQRSTRVIDPSAIPMQPSTGRPPMSWLAAYAHGSANQGTASCSARNAAARAIQSATQFDAPNR